jgi:hypothetical protein
VQNFHHEEQEVQEAIYQVARFTVFSIPCPFLNLEI